MVKFKVFMKALCEARIEWNKLISEALLKQLQNLVSGLSEFQTLAIPRCYLEGVKDIVLSYKLCGYCNASISAYAAVIYLLIEMSSGSLMRFVVDKTRVAPLKKQSIPRLELLAECSVSEIDGHRIFN